MATAYKKLSQYSAPPVDPNNPYGLTQPANDPFQQATLNRSTNFGASGDGSTIGNSSLGISNTSVPQFGQPGDAELMQKFGLSAAQLQSMHNDPAQAPLLASLNYTLQTQAKNDAIAQGLQPLSQNAQAQTQNGTQTMMNAQALQQQSAFGLQQGQQNLINQQGGYVQNANSQDAASLGQYGNNLGAATGMQLGAYGQLANTYGSMSQLSPTAFNANLQAQTYNAQNYNAQLANYQTSQAQLSDYQTYQAQQAAYQGYQAQLAQYQQAAVNHAGYQTSNLNQAGQEVAYSDAGDVGKERGAASQLNDIAHGSLNVTNGQGSPEANAAQLSALNQYGALTSPEVTAKEKFLYEQQRQNEEQTEASSRAALMTEYRQRGLGGSNAELGSILESGQQNSQNRLLGDLGTQAGAVDRSMQALAGYGGLATSMQSQANQIAQGNQGVESGAAGAYGQLTSNIRGQSDNMSTFNAGQGNTVRMFNAQQGNQNNQFNANAYNTNQMFNTSADNTGAMFNANAYNNNQQFNADATNTSRAFNANAFNSNQQFNANANNQASQFDANAYNQSSLNNSQVVTQNNQFNANAYNSNQQFNANSTNQASQFNAGANNQAMQFNTGQVNAVNMQNQSQNQIQSQFADQYRASQQQDAQNRANNLATAGISVGQNYATNSSNLYGAQQGTTQNAYARNSGLTSLGNQAVMNNYNAQSHVNDMSTGVGQQQIANGNNTFNRGLAIGQFGANNNNAGNAAIGTGLGQIAGGQSASQAQAAIAANDPGGLLGTGILGKNGIIGLKGVPIL